MKRYDQISGLVCLCIALLICFKSSQLPIGSWRDPGPGFLPLGSGIFFGLLSVALYFQGRIRKLEETEQLWFPKRKWKTLILVLAATFGYAIFLEILGFIFSTFLLLFFLLKVIEPQRWIVAIGGGVFGSLSAYALFGLLLRVQLPKGFIGF